jgi:hypothetical protein
MFLGVVFKTNKFAAWPHVSLHRFLQPFLVLAAHGTLQFGIALFPKRSVTLKGKHAGPGPWALHSNGTGWSYETEIRAPLNFWPVIAISLYCCILSRSGLQNGPMVLLAFSKQRTHCEVLLWISSELGWGRNIRAFKSDHEASAKASAHLLIANQPLPPAGTFTCQE